MAQATVRRYRCERCGCRIPTGRAMFSRFTRKHYCLDIGGCDRRSRNAEPNAGTKPMSPSASRQRQGGTQ